MSQGITRIDTDLVKPRELGPRTLRVNDIFKITTFTLDRDDSSTILFMFILFSFADQYVAVASNFLFYAQMNAIISDGGYLPASDNEINDTFYQRRFICARTWLHGSIYIHGTMQEVITNLTSGRQIRCLRYGMND